MKAIIFKEHGDIDRLIYTDVPEPKIGSDEVLIRVRACALNHLDIWTRQGMPGVPIPLPHILGCDISGEVEKIGANVTGISKGMHVIIAPGISCGSCNWCKDGWDSLCDQYKIIGFQIDGGYAEFVKVPVRNLIPISDRYSWEEWAACPLVFLTAWHMLITRAKLQKGETVLVHAAGSGVGSAGIQIAKVFGARVITTVGSDEKEKRAKELGADEVINYKKTDFGKRARDLTQGQGVDIVLEHIGAETFLKSLAALAKRGRLVTCGTTSGSAVQLDLRFLFVRQHAVMGCYMGGLEELNKAVELLNKGSVKPVVDSTFPLTEAREAHQRMLDRKNFGKIVLKI
ncbi:MAG: alcohol dehydrogenase [Omnitrophica bacterium RIFCSPHIGHO2_02_FULL_46_11]|nr:MAG: alcohol dehydrogenase [Omnitrophica bacterium RIFCSPHIGHO2_02_FULL_46_11]OGW87763.1 MAG: alcohol dehydrogenase [Omnitrophica bacterium RIFCSPLOWO2_01_FULL_45_10b]